MTDGLSANSLCKISLGFLTRDKGISQVGSEGEKQEFMRSQGMDGRLWTKRKDRALLLELCAEDRMKRNVGSEFEKSNYT